MDIALRQEKEGWNKRRKKLLEDDGARAIPRDTQHVKLLHFHQADIQLSDFLFR